MELVELEKPQHVADMVATLLQLAERADKGEIVSLFVLAFRPSGEWQTIERGRRMNRLETIGILETLKTDVIAATDVGDQPVTKKP